MTQAVSTNSTNPFVVISQQELNNPKILGEKLALACKKGFYFIEARDDCKPLIQSSIDFGYNFFNNDYYKKLNIDSLNGYRDRENYQIESLILEEKHWQEYLPNELEVAELATKMAEIGIALLKTTLAYLKVPENEWSLATGGATDKKSKAANFLSFHHYRPEKKECEGLPSHRDIGALTILYVTKPGLEVHMDGELHPVVPLKDYFLINYGQALETFINHPSELTAAWHRVVKIAESRTSFGVFINHAHDAPVYRKIDGKIVKEEETHLTYMMKKFSGYDVPPEIMRAKIEIEMQDSLVKT
jgi:isopenicillin N synthase-like dioxygenase